MIPVYKPYLPQQSLVHAHNALDSTWISSQGVYLNMVTERLQDLFHTKYVISLNNGTSACHLMAKALLKICPVPYGAKKKIIVPNNVYVAAWNAFLFDKEYELIPIDANIDTWNVDLIKLEQAIKDNPDADVLIVHNIGNVVNVPRLQNLFPGTHFVEDNCEGFLGAYGPQITGQACFASAVSFFGNKNLTSGEGGAFVTNSPEIYDYVKCLQGQGQSGIRFLHSELGYNYRMNNIQAAILLGQIDLIQDVLSMKKVIFDKYRDAFKDRDDVRIQINEAGTSNANWMFGIRVIGQKSYDDANAFFAVRNIEIRPMFYSISSHTHMRDNLLVRPCETIVADQLHQECIILPSFPELSSNEQDYIINVVNEYVKGLNP